MKNYIQNGEVYTKVAPEGGIASGELVNIGAMTGVAATSGLEGDKVAVNLEGVFEVEKTTGVAMTAGDELYVNTTTKKATKVSTDKALGICWESADSGDTKVVVKLQGKKGDANGTLGQAANVTALGSTTNMTAVPGSFADVAAVRTYFITHLSEDEARLDAIEAKVDAVIAALKTAGLMATS